MVLLENATPAYPSLVNDSGTGQDGTVLNAALFEAIRDSINNIAHSTTNPTLTPKAIIDEVVTARGSKASLDARLDVSLEENGDLKTQASLVSVTQAKAFLGSRNVVLNGDLEDWANGGALAPDNWTLSGAGAAIARTGPAMADTFTFGSGTYAAKLTRAGADVRLTQTVVSAGAYPGYEDFEGMSVSMGANGKTSIASHLRIVVDDGASTTTGGATGNGTHHTGGGTQEWLYCTHVISASATKLDIYAEVRTSNGDAYVGGFMLIFSSIPPGQWMPLSGIQDASATSRGVVTVGAQQLGTGVKTFGVPPIFKPGAAASADAVVSGRVHTNTTAVGNVGAGADDLQTHSLTAGTLSADGKVVRVTVEWDVAANGNNKTMEYLIGATVITLRAANPDNNLKFRADILIIRTGAATGRYTAQHLSSSTPYSVFSGTIAETWANAITLKGRGTGTADNDIVMRSHVVEVVG